MKLWNHSKLGRALCVAVVLAGLAVPAAQADPWQLESLATAQAARYPDALMRALANQRDPKAALADALDRALVNGSGSRAAASRLVAYEAFRTGQTFAPQPASADRSFSLEWPSVGVGAGMALALAMLAGGFLIVRSHPRVMRRRS